MDGARLQSLLGLCLILCGCSSLPEHTIRFTGLSDCPRQTPQALLAGADQLGPGSSTHALQCALTVARESQENTLLGSALPARVALHLAERTEDAATREALALEGVQLARQALRQGSGDDGEVRYFLAANLGLAIHDHPLEAADQVTTLERELLKAVELAPGVDAGGPLRLLGMLYLKAPSWPKGIGDGDKALLYLKRSVEQFPAHPLNHLFLAQAYWEVEEDGSKSSAEWKLGMSALNAGRWGYNTVIWNREFQKVAREIDALGS